MKEYDVIWIGTGQATGTVVPRLARAGKTVAVVEGGRFGGTCVNYGCTPTKTIVASARAAHMARRGPDFGVCTGEVSVDFSKVMERQNKIRHTASQALEQSLGGLESITLYHEFATFAGPNTVRVGDQLLTGETIVINAGARPRSLPVEGLDEVAWLDNARLLDLKELPEHLVIVGGSYISLEFAQAFRRLGSRVTVIEESAQLIFREDADIAQIVQELLEGEGIRFYLNARVKRVAQESAPQDAAGQNAAGQIDVFFEHDGEEKQVQGSHLLLAVGRVPNSDRLNLQAAGVAVDERGYIQVNDQMQTSVPHIYALGDINGEGAFTHTSVNDGEIFWDFYSDNGDRSLAERIPTYAMYIDPPLGRVGMSEKEARESGRNVLMATLPMSKIARAKEKDETAGLVKILVDADSEQFLGVAILGVGGDEVVNMFTPFMVTQQSYKLFRKAVLTHPTVAEMMPWILDDLQPLANPEEK